MGSMQEQPLLSMHVLLLMFGAILQVVNKAELTAMEAAGIPLYAINVAVSLAIPIPGFKSDISAALIQDMPFGALTLVWAVRS